MSAKQIYKIIGKRVKMLRERHDYSQEEVAHALGYKSRVTVSKIENGDYTVNADMLEKLSKLFHIPVNEFLQLSESEEPQQNLWAALQQDTDLAPEDISKILDYVDYLKSKK